MKGVRKEYSKYYAALQIFFASEFKLNYSELESVPDNENETRNKNCLLCATFMDTQLKTQHFHLLVGLQTFSWWCTYHVFSSVLFLLYFNFIRN